MAKRCWASSRTMVLLSLRLLLISGFMRHDILRAFPLISTMIDADEFRKSYNEKNQSVMLQ
jgi:hypothetical protein